MHTGSPSLKFCSFWSSSAAQNSSLGLLLHCYWPALPFQKFSLLNDVILWRKLIFGRCSDLVSIVKVEVAKWTWSIHSQGDAGPDNESVMLYGIFIHDHDLHNVQRTTVLELCNCILYMLIIVYISDLKYLFGSMLHKPQMK